MNTRPNLARIGACPRSILPSSALDLEALSLGITREPEELSLFDPWIRWILGDRSKPVGTARYAFFTAAGGVRPGKQNNLRISALDKHWIGWPELVQNITKFVAPG